MPSAVAPAAVDGQRLRQRAVLGFERGQVVLAVVPRVDVEDEEGGGDAGADEGVRVLVPPAHDGDGVGGGVLDAVPFPSAAAGSAGRPALRVLADPRELVGAEGQDLPAVLGQAEGVLDEAHRATATGTSWATVTDAGCPASRALRQARSADARVKNVRRR